MEKIRRAKRDIWSWCSSVKVCYGFNLVWLRLNVVRKGQRDQTVIASIARADLQLTEHIEFN